MLVRSGFAHADESAAVVDEPLHCSDDLLICPVLSAGISGVGAAHIQDHIDIIQDLRCGADIVKADKLHIKGSAAQRLDNSCIGIIFLIVDGMMDHMVAPRTHPAPAVEDSYFLDAVGCGSFDIFIKSPKLLAYAFHIIDEIREFHCQL